MNKEEAIKLLQQIYPNGGHCWLDEQRIEAIGMAINALQEEPVSEDLGKVGSLKSLEYYPEKKTTNKTSKGVFDANMPRRKAYLRGFKDGAHAHKELIANKPVSEDLEEAINAYIGYAPEVDECSSVYGKRQAFKAGAKWQKEKMMTKAIGGVVTFDYDDSDDKTYGCIAHDSFCLEDFGLKDMDEVKIIVIKED